MYPPPPQPGMPPRDAPYGAAGGPVPPHYAAHPGWPTHQGTVAPSYAAMAPAGQGAPGPFAPQPPLPSSGRRALSVLGTIGAVALTFVVGMVASTYDAMRFGDDLSGFEVLRAMLSWGLTVCVAASVVLRERFSVVVCLATAAAGVLAPVGAVAPLLALPFVLAREKRWGVVIGCMAATAVSVGVALWRDLARDGESVIFSFAATETSEATYLAPVGYVIIGVLCLSVSVGAGFVRRALRRADDAQTAVVVEARRADVLQTQATEAAPSFSRQDEREVIAREMHDTVAHNLSVVSLQASALEVTTDDPEVVDAARTMRSSAHRALDEMRSLITSLRAGAEEYTGSAPALGDLADLLDDARRGGVDLAATVFVSDADAAPPALTRAVYRVVQEALTNVMKHAPGARAEVDVRARPGAGVDIAVRNALTRDLNPYSDVALLGDPGATVGSAGIPGAGAGIVGMRERCDSVGGTFSAGVDDGRFVVTAHLPWERATP